MQLVVYHVQLIMGMDKMDFSRIDNLDMVEAGELLGREANDAMLLWRVLPVAAALPAAAIRNAPHSSQAGSSITRLSEGKDKNLLFMNLRGHLERRSDSILSEKPSPLHTIPFAVPDQEMLQCAHWVADHVRSIAAHDEGTGQFIEGDREVFEEVGCRHPCLEWLASCGCPAMQQPMCKMFVLYAAVVEHRHLCWRPSQALMQRQSAG